MLLKEKRCQTILLIIYKAFLMSVSDREDSGEQISNEENSDEENWKV